MKRIGILTFHRAVNYGAVLQAYALQKELEELGYSPKIIDYRCRAIERQYKPFCIGIKGGILQTVKNVINLLFFWRERWEKRKSFQQFLQSNMDLTPSYSNSYELTDLNDKFDLIIAGSDQVWSPICAQMDPVYFLDFVKDSQKKYSYAASFGGSKIPTDREGQYRHFLSSFKGLSVREQCSVQIIHDLLHREAFFDLDPTLLLCCDEWMKLVIPLCARQGYVLIYTIQKPDQLIQVAREISKSSGLKIIYLNNAGVKQRVTNRDIQFDGKASPQEYISLFQNAQYVLTNSFHGTAFSIIFQKQFLTELITLNGTRDNRVQSLLSLLGLQRRIIGENACSQIEQSVDWGAVNEKLENARQESIRHLKQMIS